MSALKPGWADKIDPALVGLSDADQALQKALQVSGGKRFRFPAPGSEAYRERAARGGKRGAASRVARKKLEKL